MERLTNAQNTLLQAIERLKRAMGMSPTVQELAVELGVKGSSVFEGLKRLEEKGYIRRRARTARSIEILHAEGEVTKMLNEHYKKNYMKKVRMNLAKIDANDRVIFFVNAIRVTINSFLEKCGGPDVDTKVLDELGLILSEDMFKLIDKSIIDMVNECEIDLTKGLTRMNSKLKKTEQDSINKILKAQEDLNHIFQNGTFDYQERMAFSVQCIAANMFCEFGGNVEFADVKIAEVTCDLADDIRARIKRAEDLLNLCT